MGAILCLAGMGLACACVLKYLDNVYRCFAGVAQVMLTVALSRLLPPALQEGKFDIWYALALVMLTQALVIYQAYTNPNFKWHLCMATFLAVCVSLFCMSFDGTLKQYTR